MELNPYLKVFCANGYYDAVTPFLQTKLNIENMPLGNPESRHKTLRNLVYRTYQSGHMIYLDKDSRKEMKDDLGEFYDEILAHLASVRAGRTERLLSRHSYRRRFNRTPY
jgi:carboxypeptidase C (cathepsin A)